MHANEAKAKRILDETDTPDLMHRNALERVLTKLELYLCDRDFINDLSPLMQAELIYAFLHLSSLDTNHAQSWTNICDMGWQQMCLKADQLYYTCEQYQNSKSAQAYIRCKRFQTLILYAKLLLKHSQPRLSRDIWLYVLANAPTTTISFSNIAIHHKHRHDWFHQFDLCVQHPLMALSCDEQRRMCLHVRKLFS